MTHKEIINFTFDDEDGLNPTGEPIQFEFEIECSYQRGYAPSFDPYWGGDPGSPPEVEILSIKEIHEIPVKEFATWFGKYIDQSQHTYNKIYQQVCQQVEENRYDGSHD